jgi:hypothetical protein
MAMKLLAFHNQFVPYLASYDQDDNLVSRDIIQGAQVACPQFKLGERIGAQAFDCFRGCCRLMLKPRLDRRFRDSLLAYGQ